MPRPGPASFEKQQARARGVRRTKHRAKARGAVIGTSTRLPAPSRPVPLCRSLPFLRYLCQNLFRTFTLVPLPPSPPIAIISALFNLTLHYHLYLVPPSPLSLLSPAHTL